MADPSREQLLERIAKMEAQNRQLSAVESALKKSLHFTESLLSAIPTAVFFKDVEGRYLGCNPAFTEVMGVTSEEIRGKTVHELWPSEHAEVYHQHDLDLMQRRERQVYEFEVKDRDGVIRPVVFYKNTFLDEIGALAGLVGGFVDLSDSKKAEREFQAIFTMSLDLLCISDLAKDTFVRVNPAFENTLGYSEAELLERPFLDFIHPDDVASTQKVIEENLRQGKKVFNFRNRYRCKSGEYRWLNWMAQPLAEQGLNFAVAHDITDEIHTHETLKSQADLLNSLFDNVLLGVTVWDGEGRLMLSNKGFTALTGYQEGDIASLKDWFPKAYPDPEYRQQVIDDWQAAQHRSDAVREFKVTCKDGQVKDVEFRASFLEDGRALVTMADVTEQRRAQADLETSHRLLQSVLNAVPDLLIVVDRDFRILYCNDRGHDRIQPLEGAAGQTCYGRFKRLSQPCEDCSALPVFDTGGIVERRMVNPADDRVREVRAFPILDANGDVIRVVEYVRDITEKIQLERQLELVQRFEAMGTLAGGVAHDFNNLLMGIQGHTSLMKVDLPPEHPHADHLDAIEQQVRSAAALTRQLLGFARGGKYEVKPQDISELVINSAELFSRTRKEIRVHIKTPESPLVSNVDRGQIEQVLLNLMVNAWQAMPDGGDLFLETRKVALGHACCSLHDLEPGDFVELRVTDTGIGMDARTRSRIFDPFFTTKEKKRGTGLGLASAYGIVKNHGGLITVTSEPGLGSTFCIYLPFTKRPVPKAKAAEMSLQRGREVILLVDDEQMILAVGRDMLERMGYQVLTATSGEEAVEMVSDSSLQIDLVLLDLIMPGMDGEKTFQRLRALRPGLKVLLSSGYAFNEQTDRILKQGATGFIQKPYDLVQLSKKVREALDLNVNGQP